MAEQIVNDIKEAGGVMTLSDLENFEVAKRTPLKTKINNMHILTTGAPSSGAFLALALKVCFSFSFVAWSLFFSFLVMRFSCTVFDE